LVITTFHLKDYWVSQIPHPESIGYTKELIGAAKIGGNALPEKGFLVFFA
jgi:hypothetical protein